MGALDMLFKMREWSYTQLSDSQLEWPHMFYQWLCVRIMEVYFRLFYKMRVIGRENKPKGYHAYVVACNHVSSLDPPLVSFALDFQPISYLAKIELFEKPLMRLYNWGMSSIGVNRSKLEVSTVKSALKVLKHGQWALGIFPEGTRQKSGEVAQAKKGVAFFACAAKVPVLPLGIVLEEKNGKKHMEVRIGQLIPYEPDMESLNTKVEAAIRELVNQTKQELGVLVHAHQH